MRRSLTTAAIALTMLLVFPSLFAQEPVREKGLTAEGVIVAFQKGSRHSVKPYASGIATFVEFWIVRIDKWSNNAGPLSDKDYILVEYNLYERALTDCEINAKKLRFTLRERRENEHTNCFSSIEVEGKWRPPQLSDYNLTTPGTIAPIPSLLPSTCLIADHAPVVIE